MKASNVGRDGILRAENEYRAPRVLIVDDEGDQSLGLIRKLRGPESAMKGLSDRVEVVQDLIDARIFLAADSIDIYFLDLRLSEKFGEGLKHESVGKEFVREVVDNTNAGIIVYSSFPAETEAPALLQEGADEYIVKNTSSKLVGARTLAVWRRVLESRPQGDRELKYAHVGRTFLVGDWRFVVGDRNLKDAEGKISRMSPTEHAFLQHLCTIEGHCIDSDTLNLDVLKRKPSETHVRLDNLVYRLSKKLGEKNLHLDPNGHGVYELFNVREIRRQF